MPWFGQTWTAWSMGISMLLSWLVPLVIVGLLIYLAIVWSRDRRLLTVGSRPQDALSILKERYARGEIPTEDYHRMREELN
ncbi:MAG: SHOCT domain-containing protein, partial [Desulfotomaculales bacterium]